MEATAWKEQYCTPDRCLYRLQINNVCGRSEKKIQRIVADWSNSGRGWNPKNNTKMLLFSKVFESEQAWLNWAKQFPYKLIELNSKGNPKRTKLGIDAINKKNKRKVD